MGLDMYAFKIPANIVEAEVDFKIVGDDIPGHEEIHYWRKHPNLHGWMEQLYRKKGGTSEDFNCDNVVLTLGDLDNLEQDILSGKLPSTSGFFFGQSSDDEEAVNEDLTFVKEAKSAIAEGNVVYYTSWW